MAVEVAVRTGIAFDVETGAAITGGLNVAGAGAGIGAMVWTVAMGGLVTAAVTGPVNSAGGVLKAIMDGAFTGTPSVAIG